MGPGDNTVHKREDGPTVQLCGDSNVACKWINGEFAQGTKHKHTPNNAALVTFSQDGVHFMQNVHTLQPIPNQTEEHPWQLQYPATYLQIVHAVLGTQDAVQLVTQGARESLNDQRETARLVLHHQQIYFLAATHQNIVLARQNFSIILARNSEAHKKGAGASSTTRTGTDARFSQRPREMSFGFSQEADQALEHQRENVVSEVTSEVWRRDEQV